MNEFPEEKNTELVKNMESQNYEKTEGFVLESFKKADREYEMPHFVRTAYWLKKLKEDTDDALLIAAIAHDIERAYREKDVLKKKNSAGYTDIEFFRPHEERGAEIIGDFLKEQGMEDNLVERVKMLVSRHEEGGNDDQNLLKDADSISFFENNASLFIDDKSLKIGKEKVKQKFDWMYGRITSDKAKEIARPLYEKANELLELK